MVFFKILVSILKIFCVFLGVVVLIKLVIVLFIVFFIGWFLFMVRFKIVGIKGRKIFLILDLRE